MLLLIQVFQSNKVHHHFNLLNICPILIFLSPVPAFFEHKTSHIESKRGDTAKLICEAFGDKPIKVTWFKQKPDGGLSSLTLDQTSSTYPRYTGFEKHFSNDERDKNTNKTIFELLINNVDSNDSGQYVCKASNQFGEDVRTIMVLVQDVPNAPHNVRIEQKWSRDATVSWSVPTSNGNSMITNYVIQYWRDNVTSSTAHRLFEEEISATFTSTVLRNKLTPGTSYAIRVLAINEFGRGLPSNIVKFTTHEEEPEMPPIDVLVQPKGTSMLRIKWKAPPKSHWNGQIKGYYLGYRLVDIDEAKSIPIGDIASRYNFKEVAFTGTAGDNYQEEFELSGLARETTYGVIVKAFNNAGEGPSSQEIVVSTSNNGNNTLLSQSFLLTANFLLPPT